MNGGSCAVIILAAGFSQRVGGLKPLLPLGNTTIADNIISIFLRNNVDVYLVVGYRQDDVIRGINKDNIHIVSNPDYAGGMFTSVQAGIRNLSSGYKRFFVMPVDVPLVRPSTIARLLTEAEKQPLKIIYPVFSGRRGHPPLIPFNLATPVCKWNGENGLKGALAVLDESPVEVTVADRNVLFDVDTREDYDELLGRFKSIDIPTDTERQVILNDICKIPQHIIAHCRKVAEVALKISHALTGSGLNIDIDAVLAAAELHDMARLLPKHEDTGAVMLADMGFTRIAGMVAMHMDMPEGDGNIALEAKVLYLSDKYVDGQNIVTLEERYGSAASTSATIPEIAYKIEERKRRALKVKCYIESLIGQPLEKIISA